MARGKEIDKRILKFLKQQEWPSTTEDVAKNSGVSWQTAQIHLFKLKDEGKVKYRKVGKQNQWWLAENYKKDFEKPKR